MSKPRFQYSQVSIRDLEVRTRVVDDGKGKAKTFEDLYVHGQHVMDTPRFWGSLQSMFGFSSNVFKYFDHYEVFNRISERSPREKINLTMEVGGNTPTMLAVANPNKATLKYENALELLGNAGINEDEIQYSNGIIQSVHKPMGTGHQFSLRGDNFENQFALDIPIDGYGNPATYLMLLRLRCTNGAIAMTPAFKSEINIGRKEGIFALSRVLDGYNNEDGFAALRSRWESAQTSFASLNEVNGVYKTLLRLGNKGGVASMTTIDSATGNPVSLEETADQSLIGRFNRMVGDPGEMYGIANLDGMSVKKQRSLPAKCDMYSLLNFVTEVATHHANPNAARALQALQGELVTGEYDLEGTRTKGEDWRTFMLTDSEAISTHASLA